MVQSRDPRQPEHQAEVDRERPLRERAALADLSRRARADTPSWKADEHVSPMVLAYFLAAAVCFQQSTLEGGSDGYFITGAVCLTLSVGLPLYSRLRTYRSQRRRRGMGEPT